MPSPVAQISWVEVRFRGPEEEILSGFEVSETPVTVAQFNEFLTRGGYANDRLWSEAGRLWKNELGINRPAYWMQAGYEGRWLPVTGISFFEAQACAQFFGADLLTEQEWYAVASNQGRTRYPWGDDDEDIPGRRANLSFFGKYRGATLTDVGRFPEGRTTLGTAGSHGILDLLGNASEWCYPGDKPGLVPGQSTAVLRGGSFWHDPQVVDASFRDEVTLEVRDNQTGIRLIRRTAGGPMAPASPSKAAETASPRRAARPLARPSRPFRQEGIPSGLDESTWRLEVGGEVGRPLVLTLDEIKDRYPRSTRKGLYVCVCRWGSLDQIVGIALRDLIVDASPLRPAEDLFLLQRSVPGPGGKVYESCIPLVDTLAHDTILCYELDGRPLSLDLGWPLRLIDFHYYAYKQVKCLGQLVLTTRFMPGWWEEQCRYDPAGIVQPGTITVVGMQPFRKEIEKPGIVPII